MGVQRMALCGTVAECLASQWSLDLFIGSGHYPPSDSVFTFEQLPVSVVLCLYVDAGAVSSKPNAACVLTPHAGVLTAARSEKNSCRQGSKRLISPNFDKPL